MTNTENYNLNLPDADDFYNIEDINENMETIDAAMFSLEENIGQTSEKIGSSADTGTETVMAKLNSVISSLSAGMTAVKSIQSGIVYAGTTTSTSVKKYLTSSTTYPYAYYMDITISQVTDISKCQVSVQTWEAEYEHYFGYMYSKNILRVFVAKDTKAGLEVEIEKAFRWEVTEFK